MSFVQRDSILRLIEQLGQVIAIAIGLAKGGQPDEALQVIDQALKGLVGFDLDDIEQMRAEDVIQMVRLARSGHIAPAEMVAGDLAFTAGLLAEAAEIHGLQGELARRDTGRLKALQLYLTVLTEEQPDLAVAVQVVPSLLEKLEGYELPYQTIYQLWQYHEQRGEFARAEDRLFELLDNEQSGDEIVGDGIAFFLRLLDRTDAELEAGGLPRDEVEAGLDELRGLAPRVLRGS